MEAQLFQYCFAEMNQDTVMTKLDLVVRSMILKDILNIKENKPYLFREVLDRICSSVYH